MSRIPAKTRLFLDLLTTTVAPRMGVAYAPNRANGQDQPGSGKVIP
jgi:hypothetical protein